MKKYLFSLMAIAIAVVAVSFTTESSRRTDVFFKYKLTTYTQAQVQDPKNWEEVSDITTGCDNFDEVACRIKVDASVTKGTSPSRLLQNIPDGDPNPATINAAQFSTNNFYVLQSGSVLLKRNKTL